MQERTYKVKSKSLSALRKREILFAYLTLSPVIIWFFIFMWGPIGAGLLLSLYNWDMLTPAVFCGGFNYLRLSTDLRFVIVLRNSLYFTGVYVGLIISIGLCLAELLTHKIRPKAVYLFRAIYIFPLVVTMAVVAIIWKWMLNTEFGVFNYFLSLISLESIPWLTSSKWSMPSIIMMCVWRDLGFSFLLFVAGIANIPRSLHEAAEMDGANFLQRFVYVTIPCLSPTIFFAIVICMINSFQMFAPIHMLTRGGPGDATRVLAYYLYENAFRYFKMGYAASIAVILLGMIMLLTVIQWKIQKLWVFYR